MNFPAELRYTKEHEWIRLDGSEATIGITDFAQHQLGDIVYVDISTIGKSLAADEVFGTVEAVKTVSDLFLPVAGTIRSVNPLLEKQPELAFSGSPRAHFCAEAQSAIGECLADRCRHALEKTGRKLLTLSGGVSANQTVYRMLEEATRRCGAKLLTAARGWNTDNAAMIAAVTARRALDQAESNWERDADPRWSVALKAQD